MRDMTRYDAERLRQLIENHRHYTGSERARRILENWEEHLPRFVKVMPIEYRKALEQMAPKQAASGVRLHDGLGSGLKHDKQSD